ncbi:prepilin peptidase [Caulobacter sp. NIBR2454]|uniref:prepilin peptidase n=1 Tax=Caulobacter sp. NIBR2454 TaxID=3015996 RepID=UPI0022B6AEBF|nr:A24 family peptidase [Caulobacter sp. NIBR2454]
MTLASWALTILLAALLTAITVSDLRQTRIPNLLNLALASTGLAWRLVQRPEPIEIARALADSFLVLATFAVMSWLIWSLRRLRGARDAGLGMGDLKFLAAAAIWCGYTGTLLLYGLACLGLIIVSLMRRGGPSEHPFGPYLAAGFLTVHGLRVTGAL